jgi:hypothetical protein
MRPSSEVLASRKMETRIRKKRMRTRKTIWSKRSLKIAIWMKASEKGGREPRRE